MAGEVVTDWNGRLEDVLFMDVDLQKVAGRRRVPLSFGETTRYVAGIQKCVQAFLSLLLTRLGSARNSSYGTDFMSAVRQQQIRTEVDLRNQFALAVTQLAAQINEGVFEPDERFAAATVLAASVEQDRMSLTILLTTEAGISTAFLAPIERLV